jgi:polygalacturonase
VSDGIYATGQIVLLSGVLLEVTPSAVILGSSNIQDYPSGAMQWAVVYAESAKAVGIIGGGIVDGNFSAFIGGWDDTNKEFIPRAWGDCIICPAPNCTDSLCRPRLVLFVTCENVLFKDITLQAAPAWTLHVLNSSHVLIQNISSLGDERWPNNDGIDIDSCQHVVVEHSLVNTADDGVCIKSGGCADAMEVYNVTVRDMRIRSRSNAIKFGSTTPVDMHDLLFEHIVIFDSNGGVSIQARDGGTISNVTFRDMFINGTRQWPGVANAGGATSGGWWGSGEI